MAMDCHIRTNPEYAGALGANIHVSGSALVYAGAKPPRSDLNGGVAPIDILDNIGTRIPKEPTSSLNLCVCGLGKTDRHNVALRCQPLARLPYSYGGN
jgi:hypothetical protein